MLLENQGLSSFSQRHSVLRNYRISRFFLTKLVRLETDPTAARMKTGLKRRKLNSPLNASEHLQQNLQPVIQRRLVRFVTFPAKKEEESCVS